MAIIQRIRTRAGILLAVVIGLALLAFILGDLFTSGGSIMRKSKMNVAEINGTKVGYREYQQTLSAIEQVMKAQYQTNQLDENLLESIREEAWQSLIHKYLLQKEYGKIGLAVSDNEFADLIQGDNPHPLIARMFMNPETGVLDKMQLAEFLSRIDEITGAPKLIWVYYEDVINKQRLYTKYNTLISKGVYANKLEVQEQESISNTSADISYIKMPYSEISDSSVVVSESDMKKYYKSHIKHFQQEESRDLEYVAIDIIPSEQDVKDAEAWIIDSKEELAEVEDVAQYINFNSPPYDPTNYKKGELPDALDEFMFSSDLGAIYGPYFEDNSYKLAKLAKIQYLSDSVKASHILLPANQNNVEQVRALADSLKIAAQDGMNFAQLVKDNSQDYETILAGGDLGWFKEGMLGKYFSDSCFYANTGDVKVTYSEKGFHVVKVTAKSKPVKKVQVGVLYREVTPSSKTDQLYYSKAVEFASAATTPEQFEEAVVKQNLRSTPAYGIKPMDREIPGLENSRDIVFWAFSQNNEGVLKNDINEYGGKYAVVMLETIHKEGAIPFEEVQEDIHKKLTLLAKGEKLSKKLANAADSLNNDFDAIATALYAEVGVEEGLRYTSFRSGSLGSEPELFAAAIGVGEQSISRPVKGKTGVYLFKVDSRNVQEQSFGSDMTRSFIQRNYSGRINRESIETLKDLCTINDYRYRFF